MKKRNICILCVIQVIATVAEAQGGFPRNEILDRDQQFREGERPTIQSAPQTEESANQNEIIEYEHVDGDEIRGYEYLQDTQINPELVEGQQEETTENGGEDLSPKALPSGFQGKSGVSSQSLALPDGQGSMQGMGESFSANTNTGSGTFSIPISIPPGRRGVQPQIGLAYSTGTGNGPVGWGWSMGVPSITRQTDKGMPRYASSDRFMFNGGQELVPIEMPQGETWGEAWPSEEWDSATAEDEITYFRSRIEGAFMRFFYNRTQDKWLVQDRQGNHYYYGEDSRSKTVGPKGTYQWSLNRLEDVRRATGNGGNDVQYRYLQDGGNLYIEDIYWNSFGSNYGDTESYQHQLHFVYEDRPDAAVSYAAGIRIEQNLRLKRIEVRSFQYTPENERPLTRVYLLTYEDEFVSIHSRLVQVQTCGKDWDEDAGGTCMPPLELHYNQIQGIGPDGATPSPTIAGFGSFNEMVKNISVSPDVSPNEPNVDLMDVNQDGLPDVLITRPEYFGSNHAAVLNTGLDSFEDEAVEIQNPSGWSLNLENLNVSVLDIDGAGNADMLHMPYGSQYHFYRMKGDKNTGFRWVESDTIPVNNHIDFTQDALDIRLVDINNDHLIDIVRSTGTRMQHFLNLSAFPDHEGQFGSLDQNGRPVPGESIDTCVLYRGMMMQFHDGNLQFGDINGDGLMDLVDLKSGDIAYWPNRGYGQWGVGEAACEAGDYADGLEVEVYNSPRFSNPDNEGVSIADLNGDGLADIFQIRFDAVDIWFNRGDNSFTDRYIVEDTPPTNSGYYGQVRLADINGSGTVDIVWANAGGYQYLDLAGYYRELDFNGGLPTGLLERVENGLGGTTLIEYAPSTEYMVDARERGDEWETTAPMPLTVVRKVTSTDNLDAIGGPAGIYTQEYVYRNPFYDGHEAEFKGFGEGETWDRERDLDGDGNMDPEICTPQAIARGEAPVVTKQWYHRGVRPECMAPPYGQGPDSPGCWEMQHRDNPLLGLTGVSIMSEVYSPCTGEVISASLSEIEVRKLFESSDPYDDRSVFAVFPNEGRIYKYDPAETIQGAQPEAEAYPWITVNGVDGLDIPWRPYTPASPVGTFHRITNTAVNDNHGYPRSMKNDGFFHYSDAPLYEYAQCDDYTENYTTTFDPTTWVHTAVSSNKVGTQGPGCASACTPENPCSVLTKEYNDFGELTNSYVTYRDYDGSNERTVEAARKVYNEFGQVTHDYAFCEGDACQRHSENLYTSEDDGDLFYSAFIRQEIAHVPDAAVKQFTFKARWDAATAQITNVVGADGSEGAVEYDALGRFVRAYGANPETGELCPEPTKEVFYHYGTESSPMSLLETWINTSPEICGSNRWEVLYTWVDALGRGYSSVSPGDKHLGGEAAYPWMMAGITELNAKGNPISSCEPLPLDMPPQDPRDLISTQYSVQGQLAAEMPNGRWNCGKQEFDQFGRPTYSYTPSDHPDAVDGYVLSMAEYGVDEGHAYDHKDLTDPNHVGTYSTQRVDGLGRTVLTISRHKEADGLTPDAIVERRVEVSWGAADGGNYKVTSKEERLPGEQTGIRISRRALYDTLGRVRVNLDPNFGRWEYQYDDLGQLVGTTSPTGAIASYAYDQAGRLLTETYNGDVESEYFYDLYPGDEALGLTDNLEWEGYPPYAVTIGGLVAINDQSGVTISAANRGTRSETWRQVFPSDRLYHFETRVNGAGELIWSENPDGDRSTIEYYEDGVFKSSYFNGRKIIDEVQTNLNGQTETVTYADAAETVTWTGYNPVTHQAVNTVVQQQNRVYEPGGEGSQVTLMAFGYQYDVLGLLEGIADWRGRGQGSTPRQGLSIPHPTSHQTSYTGYHQSQFNLDGSLAGPTQWNGDDVVFGSVTGWPVGAAPSDAVFGYDTLYQLIEEDREYITANGVDSQLDDDYTVVQERVSTLDWKFDATGSMTEWLDGQDSGGNISTDNLGRGLGRIKNGYQLNLEAGNATCMNALASAADLPENCKRPEAIYFASNAEEVYDASEPNSGRGTCVWADYDAGGRMTRQTVRTGCISCEWDDLSPQCPGAPEMGTPGQPGYKRPVEATVVVYDYYWNAAGQLEGAAKDAAGDQLAMQYVYDASGARVIREKSNIVGNNPTDVFQDLYISGDYERRKVKLRDVDNNDEQSIGNEAFRLPYNPLRGWYDDVEGTRLVKYSSGVRIDRDWNEGGFGEEKWFLKFGNHLGSTTVVTDFDTGALVEWSTQYAYGADESHWKSADDKYNDDQGNFTSGEPYGFTGKEEDEEVGLHYFGARYYSAYLGRWLSPDPPVVHGGGVTNLYNYGGNSPYIYVDPDGNFIQAIVGAIVGAVVGFVSGMIQGDIKAALIGAVVGAAVGAVTGGIGSAVSSGAISAGTGVVASAAVSAAGSMAQTAMMGGGGNQVLLSGAISFGSGLIGGGLGVAFGQMGNAAGQVMLGYASSVGVSYAAAAVTGSLNNETWDDILISSSVSYAVGFVGSAVGAEVENLDFYARSNIEETDATSASQVTTIAAIDRSLEHWGSNPKGANWDLSQRQMQKLTQSGKVKLTDWNGRTRNFNSMAHAMDWALTKSISKNGQPIQITKAGTPNAGSYTTVNVPRKREISIVFFEDTNGNLLATANKSNWYEGGVQFDFSKVGNGKIIATTHTHPYKSGEYIRMNGMGFEVTNPQYPSPTDYIGHGHQRELYGYGVRSYVIYDKRQYTGFVGKLPESEINKIVGP